MAVATRIGLPGTSEPDSDPEIVDGLVQLSTLVQAVLVQVTAGADLSVQQGRLLGILRDREPTMAHLARFLSTDKSSTTGLVDRATRRGLVRRVADPEDGRSSRVVLTAKGRHLTKVLEDEMARGVAALTAGLDDADRRRLSRLAGRVVADVAAARGIDLST